MSRADTSADSFNLRRARETRERAARAIDKTQRRLLLEVAGIFEARYLAEQRPDDREPN